MSLPPPPTQISLTESSSDSLTVSWTAADDASPSTRYIVQYRQAMASSGDDTTDNDHAYTTVGENILETQARATNLSDEKGAGFFFRVAAVLPPLQPESADGENPRSAWTTHSEAFCLTKAATATSTATNQHSTAVPTGTAKDGCISAGRAFPFHMSHYHDDSLAGPEFREVYMCQFTTATTCYSAPRYVSGGSGGGPQHYPKASLATEQHLLEVTLGGCDVRRDPEDGTASDNTKNISFVQYPLPTPPGLPRRLAKKFICVGYSQCPHSGWEAMVLLDPTQQQDAAGTAGGGGEPGWNDDERTTVTMASVESSSTSRPPGYRRVNSGGNGSVSSDGGTSVTSLASTASAPAVIVTGTGGGGGGDEGIFGGVASAGAGSGFGGGFGVGCIGFICG